MASNWGCGGFATFAMYTKLSSGPNRGGGRGDGQMTSFLLLFLSLLVILTGSIRRDCMEDRIEYDKVFFWKFEPNP